MTLKQMAGLQAPDGSHYVTVVDGLGNLTPVMAGSYPAGAVPITASATGGTSTVPVTLAGVAGKTTYISGFTISSDATSLAIGTASITGLVTGTMNFLQPILAAASGVGVLSQTFNPPIPATAANTAIVITSAAAGIGGNTSVNAWGYQL